ncbi:MAG: branched-chain amino acid transport system permease protein [Actinomycetota bacterium]|nr:branched-chain amino acid transport system permease protein [Actinomycetota bacterium]
MTRRRLVAAVLAVAFVVLPLAVGDFGLSVLTFAGIFAVGAIGLDLAVGHAGQISLGHGFFMGVGAYAAVNLGAEAGLGLPVWLSGAAVAGGALGALVGLCALRLRGAYLAIVTVGVVFVGLYVWNNVPAISGGAAGAGGEAPAVLGPLDFNHLRVAGQSYAREQAWFWLVWALVAAAAWLAANLVRSRTGRAWQAVHDNELAASAVGVDVGRAKVSAFAVAGALGAVAGALYFGYVQYVGPDEWSLFLSVQFLAIVIVGGSGRLAGPVVGAVVLGGAPRLVEELSPHLPIGGLGLTVANLNRLLFGLLVVCFVAYAPRGLAGGWDDLQRRRRWGRRPLADAPMVRAAVADEPTIDDKEQL